LRRAWFARGCLAPSDLCAATDAVATCAARTVQFRDGTSVAVLGQGSWHLGQGRHPAAAEEEALRTGVSLGMTLIDASANYGDGRSEKFIGRAIAGQRDRVFLVSKVETDQVTGDAMARACEGSLARLGTDHLDLYLLHWPVPTAKFPGVVAGFERLRAAGKIRAWGVSNFSVRQMEDLLRVPLGDRCATNQVVYNLGARGIEHDLLPWCARNGMPVMAYSPLGGTGGKLLRDPCSRVSAQRTLVRQPLLPWPGPSAVVTSLQFPNPVPCRTSRRTLPLSRLH
jgi:diketogulonate reductase-like aldo/keto reductase